MPGYVSTKMTFERKRSDTISPWTCAIEALKDLGNINPSHGHRIHVFNANLVQMFNWYFLRETARHCKNKHAQARRQQKCDRFEAMIKEREKIFQ